MIVLMLLPTLCSSAQEEQFDGKSFWDPSRNGKNLENRFSIGTNGIDLLALGNINAEFMVAVSRHLTIGVQGRYNPWTWGGGDQQNQFQWRERTAVLNARYWPWFVYSGWWFNAGMQYQEYNKGGILNRQTEEGDAYGVNLGVGYTHMLTRHINLEFGAWMWAGYKSYATYVCPVCGRKADEGTKVFFAPDNAALSFIYVF